MRRVHTTLKPFICNYCCACFAKSNQLAIHIMQTHQRKPDSASETVATESSITPPSKKEVMKARKREKVYHCKTCDVKFSTLHRFNDHKNAKSTYDCSYCEKIPKALVDRSHLKDKLTNRLLSSIVCEYCNKEFENKCQLIGHFYRDHVKVGPETTFKCLNCCKSFCKLSHLFTHIHLRHFYVPIRK